MSYLGAIEEVGLSPYQVSGHPVMALIAQLNRFANKTVDPGARCGKRNYLPRGPIPLTTTLDDHAATIANVIMYDRLNCISDVSLLDFNAMKKVNEALGPGVIQWVMANLNNVTIQIAQFADSLDLPAASVGITARDPKMTPKFPFVTVALLGALAAAAFVVSRRKR